MASSLTAIPNFTVRPAKLASSDFDLFVSFRDSQLSWLSTVGSGGQWGSQPIRNTDSSVSERTSAWVTRSEANSPWGPDWCRAFIAEVDSTPVAGLVLDSKAPAYVRDVVPEQDDADPFVYLAYLMTNRDAGEEKTKGSGAALIRFARETVRELGVGRICLDCWRGNGRKLVQ
ncbi:hypothetical protein BU24DRAFT_421867 [Aaosphaeria arxii CBS 175.79]|uniref:N-acetyltransferase domain-containing protein n=1 Tax=Aaosphaeria arxii CBS 175.79 TaxID=1450172 RepID=A0A6A5XRP9_9PLEO|nr:uncharacterized protein BU24DRAFT_421867 [Aaosphaeria arxii CBS 175.79]KAF2015576.1 hypothetical protein BU24DRAFT_421867 [Aaosphaeria arxii CBS 175.79]